MPLRVKCRCGQEIVVRQSEWVYVFLGITLLSLLLNTVVVLLFYFRIDSPPAGAARTVEAPRSDGASPQAPVAVPGVPPAPARGASGDGSSAGAAPAEATPPRAASEPPVTPPVPPAAAPDAGPASRSAGGDLHSRDETSDADPLASILFHARPPWERAASARSIGSGARSAAGTGEASATREAISSGAERALEPLAGGGPLARLQWLERGPADPLIACALLLDPDAVVRRRAVEKLLEAGSKLPPSGAARDDARALVAAAAPRIGETAQGKKLIDSLSPLPDARADVSGILEGIREKLSSDASNGAPVRLQKQLESMAASGLDLVLAIDVSQSMEGPLPDLQREALWLLPALTWALPGARVGLLLYRDGVESGSPLTSMPADDALPLLGDARAEGGGDVPEGVHQVLRAALSLGSARWREGAEKHILLVGDGPPPYAQVPGLLSLLRSAAREGGYHVHCLGLQPAEGRSAVPFFPEIAKAGNGRSVTVPDARHVGEEVFRCLFPEGCRPSLDPLLPVVTGLFSSGG